MLSSSLTSQFWIRRRVDRKTGRTPESMDWTESGPDWLYMLAHKRQIYANTLYLLVFRAKRIGYIGWGSCYFRQKATDRGA